MYFLYLIIEKLVSKMKEKLKNQLSLKSMPLKILKLMIKLKKNRKSRDIVSKIEAKNKKRKIKRIINIRKKAKIKLKRGIISM